MADLEAQLAQQRERMRRYRAGESPRLKPDELAMEVDWLLDGGESPYWIARQLGRSCSALEKVMIRAGRRDLAAQFSAIRRVA